MELNYKICSFFPQNKYFSFISFCKNVTMMRVNLIDEIICGEDSITFVRRNYKYVYVFHKNEEPIDVYNKVIDFLTGSGEGVLEFKETCTY